MALVIVLPGLLLGCSGTPGASNQTATSPRPLTQALAQLAQSTTSLDGVPRLPVNTTVQVEGQVRQHTPLLDNWLYQLSDATGDTWVLSSSPPPVIGSMVRLEGVVQYEPVVIGGTDQGEYYLQEVTRSVVKPPEEEADPSSSLSE